jgi:hypothetical protein
MKRKMDPESWRQVAKRIIQACLGVIGYALLLIFTSGKLDWVWGWVFKIDGEA